MKKLLFFIILMNTLHCYPVYGQDVEVTKEDFLNELKYATDTSYMYTTAIVNVRKEPNTDCEILGKSLIGTEFEVVLNKGGWSMITTEDGYAFMKSDYLTDIPTPYIPEDSDLYVLAHVLTGESQWCSDEEQIYVGSVVLNRVAHPEFPNTIKEVVFQKGQYACVWDGNYYRVPTKRNWENAKWLLDNGSILPDYVIWQSRSKQGKGVYLKTKDHYYCY